MSNLPWVPRINASKMVTVTPTITAGAYTSGLQLGGIMTLTDVVRQDSSQAGGLTTQGFSELVGVTILDGDKQDSPMDIWLFNASPTVTSVDHGAFAMTAANLKLQCIGMVQVGVSGTYSDAAAVSISSMSNLNLPLQVSTSNIYAIAVCRGTPTYTTTSSIKLLFSFFLD